ncbi:MAG: M67 family metallopeptidase [Armatimonadota bacterium]|nr:M67 family metallopeptidase [Armatimonadota bacterium]
MIVLPPHIASEIIAHAREDAPVEACGLLAGADGVVQRCYRLTNRDRSPEHFTLVPQEQFAAAKDMRANGLQAVAVYHSHPASPARMSDEDLRLAVAPGIRYVIVSLMSEEPDIRSFILQDGVPVEEPALVQESPE